MAFCHKGAFEGPLVFKPDSCQKVLSLQKHVKAKPYYTRQKHRNKLLQIDTHGTISQTWSVIPRDTSWVTFIALLLNKWRSSTCFGSSLPIRDLSYSVCFSWLTPSIFLYLTRQWTQECCLHVLLLHAHGWWWSKKRPRSVRKSSFNLNASVCGFGCGELVFASVRKRDDFDRPQGGPLKLVHPFEDFAESNRINRSLRDRSF